MRSFLQTALRFPSMPIGIIGSFFLHSILVFVLWSYDTSGVSEFDFNVPIEIELGMSDELEIHQNSAPPVLASAPETGNVNLIERAVTAADDIQPLIEPSDAGVPDDASQDETDATIDGSFAEIEDGSTDSGLAITENSDAEVPENTSSVDGPSRLPRGAQLALRINIALVRQSRFSQDAERLIQSIPDWSLILEGSGVDPITDLDQVLIMTPSPLQRSRMVIAGRHIHDETWAKERAEQMATAQGQTITWTLQDGVWTAPWYNRDSTERIIALLDAHHFVVCRQSDLRRVLTIAHHRGRGRNASASTGPAQLLSMQDDEAMSIEAQGIGAYVSNSPAQIPQGIRIALVPRANNVQIDGLATFADAETATIGLQEWESLRNRYANLPFGVGEPLRALELTPRNESIRLGGTLPDFHARLVIGQFISAMTKLRSR